MQESGCAARRLVLTGDNCSENKNNTVFAFCAHLVAVGWFDRVELVFGPVGHTHGGIDQPHFVHNNVTKKRTWGTLSVPNATHTHTHTALALPFAHGHSNQRLGPDPIVPNWLEKAKHRSSRARIHRSSMGLGLILLGGKEVRELHGQRLQSNCDPCVRLATRFDGHRATTSKGLRRTATGRVAWRGRLCGD
jgi:hypothetical protein